MIRPASYADCEAIAGIYNHYILNTVVTFEEAVITAQDIAGRIKSVAAASLPWLVSERDGRIVGYAYAGKWNPRSAYRYSVECTVYLDSAETGRGLGSELYETLLPILRRSQQHVVMAGISLPNDASVALHEKFGLKKVAHFGEVGFKFNRWVDVGYWQGTL